MMLKFDIAAPAPSHSALASVLAGFAFAAVFWVIGSPGTISDCEKITPITVAALLTAFLGMVVTSFIYSAICGEKVVKRVPTDTDGGGGGHGERWTVVAVQELGPDDGDLANLALARVEVMGGMAGLILAASGILMFWAIALLMHTHEPAFGTVHCVFIVALEFAILISAATIFDPGVEGRAAAGRHVVWCLALAAAVQVAGWVVPLVCQIELAHLAAMVPGANLVLICVAIIWFALVVLDTECRRKWLYHRAALASVLFLLVGLSGLYACTTSIMTHLPA